jgi:leucyl aminopeptidase
MKKIIGSLAIIASLHAFGAPQDQWLTVDNEVLVKILPKLNKSTQSLFKTEIATIIRMSPDEIEQLSHVIHHELHRCGGFMAHETMEEAMDAVNSQGESFFAKRAIFSDYSLDQGSLVKPLMKQIEEAPIREMILKLSDFKTRHYRSDTGVESSHFIRDSWASLTAHRSDVQVELYQHNNWPQPSVIMTIPGSENPEEIIIVGGHADSIAGFWGGRSSRSPGADDNASGIATMTEAIRVLMLNNFQPKRTVKIMAYAAEEVGLLGSKEIANNFKANGLNVIGVMQLDMTLFKGTADKDIVLMTDYTNVAQNEFIGILIDEYIHVPWGYSRCGYGCSDHASWTAAGFPASMPFESNKEDSNRRIHTAQDTLQSSGGDAKHAYKFAKLATAFIVELAN